MAETRIVGIVNITPDSFSDGAPCFDADFALQAVARHIKDGAVIVDIGAESTRPGATPLSPEEEWLRLEPVLEGLAFLPSRVPFSLDTRHAATAARALEHGIRWINDVSGFKDPAMVEAVRKSDCILVVMHSLTVPADTSVVLPDSADVVQEVMAFASERLASLQAAGIARERMIFDPGIGFGKTPPQSLALLHHIAAFKTLGVPLLVGHSRKSFLAGLAPDRDDATLAVSQYLAVQGVDYLRVHDVARHRAMLDVLGALDG